MGLESSLADGDADVRDGPRNAVSMFPLLGKMDNLVLKRAAIDVEKETGRMIYRGFRAEPLLAVSHQLEGLGLKSAEVHAILNLAGAKWRSVQIREGRGNELQDPEDGRVFHEATVALMRSVMDETNRLALLNHSTDGERFMLLAISITLNGLLVDGGKSIRRWLRAGDKKGREAVLSFAIGASIVVEPRAIDVLLRNLVKFRYGVQFDSREDISGPIIECIDGLGNSGFSVLNSIVDAIK